MGLIKKNAGKIDVIRNDRDVVLCPDCEGFFEERDYEAVVDGVKVRMHIEKEVHYDDGKQ